jgi:hypothetical protein
MPFSSSKNLKFLKTIVVMIPTETPIKIEQAITKKNRNIKSPISCPDISKLVEYLEMIFIIESNNVTAIVSLNRDSPKIMENNFGYFYLFTIFSETIGSMLHKQADIRSTCQLYKSMTSEESEIDLNKPILHYYLPYELKIAKQPKTVKKLIIVPNTPYKLI